MSPSIGWLLLQKGDSELPPPKDEWVVSLFNIDDSVSVYVNDLKINQCDLPIQQGKVNSTHTRPGSNQARLVYRNVLSLDLRLVRSSKTKN